MAGRIEHEEVLLYNCKIRYIKLDPNRPSDKFDKTNPKWEVGIYTYDLQQSKEWQAHGLTVKLKLEEETSKNIWAATLSKKSISAEGTPNRPVTVRDGGRNPLDPNRIGYGSVANIRLSKWPFDWQGKKGFGFTLYELQVIKIIPYEPKPREESFEQTETAYEIPQEGGDDVPSEY